MFNRLPGIARLAFVLLGAVVTARDGKVAILTFHGVPDAQHPWVTTTEQQFKRYLAHLKAAGCTVIALRDLVKYLPK